MLQISCCRSLNAPSQKALAFGRRMRGRYLTTGLGADVWRIQSETPSAIASSLHKTVISSVSGDTSGAASAGGLRKLPTLEAMGAFGISRALSGMALCNRLLENPEDGCAVSSSHRPLRVAFKPIVRVFVLRSDNAEPNPLDRSPDEIRKCMELQLRLVHSPLKLSRLEQGDVDIIRVAAKTDLRRLGGMIYQRWCEYEEDSTSPMVTVQAMGPKSTSTMVRALALSWQKSARSHDGDVSEAGFVCLVSHIQLPDDDKENLYSPVQCELIRASA